MVTRTMQRHMRPEEPPALAAVGVSTRMLGLNIVLLFVAFAALAYYVVQANMVAAMQYDITALGDEIIEVREKHHAIGAAIADQEHPDRIAEFARSAGMVLASDARFVSIPEPPLAGR